MSPIEIGKYQINIWLALTILPYIGCWFCNLSLRVVLLCSQKRNLHARFDCTVKEIDKEGFIRSKHEKQGMKMSYISFIIFYINHFFKIEDVLCVLNTFNLNSSPQSLLNFQRPTVSWKLFSDRFINAVMTSHASSIAEYGRVTLGNTSLSVVASHSTHQQTQSGSICFKNFQIYLSFELA